MGPEGALQKSSTLCKIVKLPLSGISRIFLRHAACRCKSLNAKLRGFAALLVEPPPSDLSGEEGVQGLVNAEVIDQNLDWMWPYMAEQPSSHGFPSFVPRAFSCSHSHPIHRNWTEVGMAGLPFSLHIDPRARTTPLFAGWSMDFWMVIEPGTRLRPRKPSGKSVIKALGMERRNKPTDLAVNEPSINDLQASECG